MLIAQLGSNLHAGTRGSPAAAGRSGYVTAVSCGGGSQRSTTCFRTRNVARKTMGRNNIPTFSLLLF